MSLLLKKVRLQHGMTLEMLATKTGLTKSYLSKVERGLSKPSIEVALKIAKALNVSVEALFSHDHQDGKFGIQRAVNGVSGDPESYLSLVGGLHPASRTRVFIVRPTIASSRNRLVSHHSGEEILFVLRGQVEVKINGQTEVLRPGDCASLDPESPHKLSPVSDVPTEVLVVVSSSEEDN
ncbi:helix-turn-helix domain-containing protein [Paracoccus saliphilus]|nr:helix-turn-helix domain-containing protein [Paracoccus saliphilus]